MANSGIGQRRVRARNEGGAAYRQKRAQMVKAAAILFREKGYEATNLIDIAEAVGTGRSSIYYYVDSKEELLQEAVSDVSTGNLEMIRQLLESDMSAPDRIKTFIQHTMSSYDENYPQIFVYIQEGMSKVSRRRSAWAKRMSQQTKDFEEGVLAILRAGVADGSLRRDLNVEVVARAMWGALNWTHRWYRPGVSASAQEVADTFECINLLRD